MLKKIIFCLIILFIIIFQCLFIYALIHKGISLNTSLWESAHIQQTPFSKFIYKTIKLWWGLPAICLFLLFISLWKPNKWTVVLTFLISITGVIALLWSTYDPSMLIDVHKIGS